MAMCSWAKAFIASEAGFAEAGISWPSIMASKAWALLSAPRMYSILVMAAGWAIGAKKMYWVTSVRLVKYSAAFRQ